MSLKSLITEECLHLAAVATDSEGIHRNLFVLSVSLENLINTSHLSVQESGHPAFEHEPTEGMGRAKSQRQRGEIGFSLKVTFRSLPATQDASLSLLFELSR